MTQLHKDCFAYPGRMHYPLHTKEAMLSSYSDFMKDKCTIPAAIGAGIAERFDKAAALHGVDLASVDVMPKKASAELITIECGEGNITLTKIATLEDANKAADALIAARSSQSWESLRKAALYVMQRTVEIEQGSAEDHGIMDTANMTKLAELAGIGVGDRAEVTEQFGKRASLVHLSATLGSQYAKAYSNLSKVSDDDFYKEASLHAMCATLDEIDTLYDLKRHYGKGIEAPEHVCFRTKMADMHKIASDMLRVASTGTILSKKAIFERKAAILTYLQDAYGMGKDASDDVVLQKVASLDKTALSAMLDSLS